ncbi:MAG TPA: hypothetical protein VIE43_00120 [Thermoanaerobaculia bacterium]|jgi:hypothetical protein|nr:hypothetical protein [Thermoanaerobaculia bacterium]
MLARIAPIEDAAQPTPLMPFFAHFSAAPALPLQFQFTFSTELFTPVNNAFWFPSTPTAEVKITLDASATFNASEPIAWSIPPTGGEPTFNLSSDMKTLSFVVPSPQHYFCPWVFRIIVDASGVNAIRSQNIYLVKFIDLDASTFTLNYSADNGNFNLLDGDTDSQNGIILANQLVLVNVVTPLASHPPCTFDVELVPSDLPTGYSVAFDSATPILWSAETSPGWISASVAPDDPSLLTFTLTPDANGQSIGLQFAVNVTTSTGKMVRVLSPDPILINATIGDG